MTCRKGTSRGERFDDAQSLITRGPLSCNYHDELIYSTYTTVVVSTRERHGPKSIRVRAPYTRRLPSLHSGLALP